VKSSNQLTCNDNRFNYFDPLTLDTFSKNTKVLEHNFAIQKPRAENVFGDISNCPFVPSYDDIKAMKYKIKAR